MFTKVNIVNTKIEYRLTIESEMVPRAIEYKKQIKPFPLWLLKNKAST